MEITCWWWSIFCLDNSNTNNAKYRRKSYRNSIPKKIPELLQYLSQEIAVAITIAPNKLQLLSKQQHLVATATSLETVSSFRNHQTGFTSHYSFKYKRRDTHTCVSSILRRQKKLYRISCLLSLFHNFRGNFLFFSILIVLIRFL